LTAFILGVEVECRLANVIFGSKNLGWHVTGAVGSIGAAAAARRLLGLNEDQMVCAFGITATQPGGLRDMYGTVCKRFTLGRASQNGLGAALLAAKGFGSSDQSIEAPMGFAKILADISDLAGLTQDLGNSYEIMTNNYKPFACAIVLPPIIDRCLQLREKNQIKPDQVERVTLTVNSNVIKLAGKENPETGLEAKFSFGHVVALALVKGAAGQPQFSDALIQDAEIRNIRDRVSARVKDGIAKDEARVEIFLRGG
jgi:2-methylcitrate dehydratase PrpD